MPKVTLKRHVLCKLKVLCMIIKLYRFEGGGVDKYETFFIKIIIFSSCSLRGYTGGLLDDTDIAQSTDKFSRIFKLKIGQLIPT